MAIVFWKPLNNNGLQKTKQVVFCDIREQDSLVDKYKLDPFFSKTIDAATKILFVSDIPNTIQPINSALRTIKSIVNSFSDFFSSEKFQLFFSLRHQQQLDEVNAVFPQAFTNINATYDEMKTPEPPPWKPNILSSMPLGFGGSTQKGLNPVFSPVKRSAMKIFWPSCFQEADIIISINLFTISNIFTIHGTFTSLFYSLPRFSQTMILVQPNEQKRAQLFVEYLKPLQKKLSHSFLYSEEKEGFMILADDYISGDAFASALCSFKALKIPLNRCFHQNKWGMGDITKINLIGPSFQKPLQQINEPNKVWKRLDWLPQKCIHCMQCINACPVASWKLEKTTYRWQSKKCNHCGHCIDLCPACAIQIKS